MTYPEPTNLTGLNDLFIYANTVTNNVFGIGILISLYMIILIFLKMNGDEIFDCANTAGFITSMAAIFLFLGGIIRDWQMFITFAITIISVILSYGQKT